MITREFNLYLHAGHSIPLVINVNQYDRGETWVFTLFNSDGTQYIPSSGAIVGIKSDNLGIINAGEVDGLGRVLIDETEQMTASVGKAVFELLIDDQTHGTANFIVLVEPKPGDNADLSESDYSLFQQAIDGTSATAIAEGVADWMDENLTPTSPVVDASLTVQGAAADAKKTGDEISALKSQIAQSTGMSEEFKVALEAIMSKVYINDDDGQTLLDALHDAMYPAANLSYITAVYTQSGTVYITDSLDTLKDDLVVTAHYSDETSGVVTTYALSGELTNGESTITVSYGGKTTTFTVTATRYRQYGYIYSSSGNDDYVDTGLTHSPSWTTMNIELEALNNNSAGTADALIGANNQTTTDTSNIQWLARANKAGFSTYSLGQAKQLNTVPANTRAVCKYFFVDGGESYIQYEDTTVAVATVASSAITPNNKTLVLAGTYQVSDGKKYGMNSARKCKLGYVKFTNPSNNEVVYNFVPAQDLETSKYGFYETVNGVFYPQHGSTLRCADWS